jgi:RNA polymerase subunit RPABC4/transcription elongation factor Spt4
MQCGSCVEEVPDDSIFCPECGARQEMSRAGALPGVGGVGLGGQQVSGGRNFGVVSGEAVMNQNLNQGIPGQGMPHGMMPDIMGQIAQNMPGTQMPGTQMPGAQMPGAQMPGLPPIHGLPPGGVTPMPGGVTPMPGGVTPMPGGVTPMPGRVPQNIDGAMVGMPPAPKGPSLASGALPTNNNPLVSPPQAGGAAVSSNPSLSPTDAMVNRIAEAERTVKNERRSQWLQMNQESAANVLSSIGGELPSHLKSTGNESSTAEFLASAIGTGKDDSGNEALFRRMSEVAVRRVARKRGVAVETPQIKSENGILTVNVTYVDDGRVLDTPDDLSSAFEHAISTEVALKGLDVSVVIALFRSKDGAIDKVVGKGEEPVKEESDEEMFACEVCDGLVKESDNECPHCGAVFEEEEEEPASRGPPSRGGPSGPSSGGPPGPSRGGPPGPSRGAPPSKSPPSGPSRESPPKRSGPSGGGPPKSGGPPKRGGPPTGGPGGPPKKSGPSGGGPPKSGGPPKRGGPPGGPKRGPPK